MGKNLSGAYNLPVCWTMILSYLEGFHLSTSKVSVVVQNLIHLTVISDMKCVNDAPMHYAALNWLKWAIAMTWSDY